MADSNLVSLTEDTTPGSDSLVYTVDDPAGTPVDRKATLSNITKGLAAATTTAQGAVELATTAEVDTGTDTARAITPDALANSALQTKVNGIETAADVTDATNVASAGAVMADGTGNDLTGDIVFSEKADHSSTPGAGKGYLWVKNDTPSTLQYTDDAGTDWTLNQAAGGGQTLYDVVLDSGGGGDYTDLSTALAALTSGQTMFVRTGTYNEAAAVNFTTADVTIIGENPENTILSLNSGINTWSAGNLKIRNITLNNGGSSRWNFSGIELDIQGCKIMATDAANFCFQFTGADQNISNNHIELGNTSESGNQIQGTGDRQRFNNNYIYLAYGSSSTTTGAIDFADLDHSFCGNTVRIATNTTTGAAAVRSRGRICNNYIIGSAGSTCGISADNDECVIMGNILSGVYLGVDVATRNRCVVANNVIQANGNAAGVGVDAGGATSCAITGNMIQSGSSGIAIDLDTGDSNVVSGNAIYFANTGVNIATGGDNNVVTGNAFNTTTTDVSNSGTGNLVTTATDGDALNTT